MLVVGIGAAVGLWLAVERRLDDAVDGLARGPVGCDTVLDFDDDRRLRRVHRDEGAIDEVRGDCDVDSTVDWSGDELPTRR